MVYERPLNKSKNILIRKASCIKGIKHVDNVTSCYYTNIQLNNHQGKLSDTDDE